MAASSFGVDGQRRSPPDVASLELPPVRLSVPDVFAEIATSDVIDRAGHSLGKSYRDVVRALRGELAHPPDVVMRPRNEHEVAAVLDWCGSVGAAVVPYGGGSSVVGGVEPDVGDGYAGVVTIDTTAMDRVLDVDTVSLAARIQGGVLGPDLEDQLRPHGLTLRHFPQSFECSTLGGWIATRSGGHFATGPTHIDDLVESVRVVTPRGLVETRRVPSSGAGPSPDRLFLGSEGSLGLVTEAWVRVRRRPRWRVRGTAVFADMARGAGAVRALVQSGLQPSNCRLVDPVESMINGMGDGTTATLLVGFESADRPMDADARDAQQCVRDHGGDIDEGSWRTFDDGAITGERPPDAASSWRNSFLRAPYVRDALVTLGVLCETFETAVSWARFEELHDAVTHAVRRALGEWDTAGGFVTCRFTHAYPDGPAPYFTVLGRAVPGRELEQWAAAKEAASDALLATAGTITHHHAVGRDHRPWYDRQASALFVESLRATKSVLDPGGIMNPGVLVG